MKPRFSFVWANYPHKNTWSRQRLYREMGWDEFIDNPNFHNTCAVRTSYALIRSGMTISSSAGMRALDGVVKGKEIEILQGRLSQQLRVKWGEPEKFTGAEAEDKIGARNGIVSFWRIPGYNVGGARGGHIDVVDGKGPETRTRTVSRWIFWQRVETYTVDEPAICGSGCYMQAPEVWFWELP